MSTSRFLWDRFSVDRVWEAKKVGTEGAIYCDVINPPVLFKTYSIVNGQFEAENPLIVTSEIVWEHPNYDGYSATFTEYRYVSSKNAMRTKIYDGGDSPYINIYGSSLDCYFGRFNEPEYPALSPSLAENKGSLLGKTSGPSQGPYRGSLSPCNIPANISRRCVA